MASSVIASAGTVSDAPGLAVAPHNFYGVNTAALWCFTYRSASNTTLYAYYSTDSGVTWNTPTNPTFTLAHSNGGHGVTIGVAYANISSHDVVHFNINYDGTGTSSKDEQSHLRATLSGTTVTWGTEVSSSGAQSGVSGVAYGSAVVIASDGSIFDSGNVDQSAHTNGGDFGVRKSTNTDSGSAWTTGFPGPITLLFSSTNTAESSFYAALSSGGKVLAIGDNGVVTGTPNDCEYSLWGGASWSPATATSVFGSNANMSINDWGACLRTDTDCHAIRRTSTTAWLHRRWNGTSWGAGDSLGTSLTSKLNSGVALCTDGTTVWLFAIANAAGNAISYNTWTAGGGWAGWTTFDSTSQTRTNLTAVYCAALNLILVSWSAVNGVNFDLTVEGFSTVVAATAFPPHPVIVNQAVNRAAVW